MRLGLGKIGGLGRILSGGGIIGLSIASAASATPIAATPIELDPKLIESSPTLQQWLKQVPDLQSTIANDPAFRTRLRVGYANFNASDSRPGFAVGLEDLHLDRTPITFSADYRTNGTGQSRNWGADLHYQLNNLGAVVNLAPTIGYRQLTLNNQTTNGINVGLRTRLNLSRGGGADITFDQSWVAPDSDREAGMTKLSFGYAVTTNVRISTDWQRQQTRRSREDQWGIALEWMI